MEAKQVSGALRWVRGRLEEQPKETRLFLALTAVLVVVLLWTNPYPPGIDLPEHAHLFTVWSELRHPEWGQAPFYQTQLFTPYLLTYVAALPLTWAFGAAAAVKCILTLNAFATPYTLWRWLDSTGGEKSLWMFGLVLAFGYPYMWGFTSFGLSLPVAFLCLEAWNRSPARSFLKGVLLLNGLLTALFFTHAITFSVVALSLGILTLCYWREAFWKRALGLVLPFLVSVTWYASKGHGTGNGLSFKDWMDMSRFALLFGGEFWVFDEFWSASLGLLMLTIFVAATRPVLAAGPKRWLPLALALLGYFTLPSYFMDTMFVGPRFVALVHAFAPAAIASVTQGRAAAWAQRVSGVLVILFLLVCGVRLWGMNQELKGFRDIVARIPEGGDVHGVMDHAWDDSKWCGFDQFVNIFAWATAERHGMVSNDHARYFQLPLRQRPDTPIPGKYRYLLGRGPDTHRQVRAISEETKLIAESENWLLYEDQTAPPYRVPYGKVVRYGQDWGELRLDRSVEGTPLSIGGNVFSRGLGTHARSIIQFRANAAGKLSGACGLQDGHAPLAPVRCSIIDRADRILFSATIDAKKPLAPFEFDLPADHTVFLRAVMSDGAQIAHAHINWVDIKVH